MLNKGLLLGEKIKLYNIIRGSVSHVSLSYSPQTDIKAGTRVNITVNANGGYQNPWVTVSKNDGTGNVSVSGSGSNRYFTMPKSDVTITAGASVIPTYSVSGSASGGGISFSKTSGIRAGEVITVYLSPNSYYTLSNLTSSPYVSFSGGGNTRTFTMPSSNVHVTATFAQYYVSLSATLAKEVVTSSETYEDNNYVVYVTKTPALYNVPSFNRLRIYSRFRDARFRYNGIIAEPAGIPSNVYFKIDGLASFTHDTLPSNNAWDLKDKYYDGTRRITLEISGLPF